MQNSKDVACNEKNQDLIYWIMARPIQDTPVMTGKDAERFRANLRRALNPSQKERQEKEKCLKELEEMYNKMVEATNGVFF